VNHSLTLEEIEKLEGQVEECSIGLYAAFNRSFLAKLHAAHDNTASAEERRIFALAAEGLPAVLGKAIEPIIREIEESRRRELALLRFVVKIRMAAADLQASDTKSVMEPRRG
jgi:hypothetical protein